MRQVYTGRKARVSKTKGGSAVRKDMISQQHQNISGSINFLPGLLAEAL